ncbi:MAG: hypothetical protein HY705_01650, partial [Gemmatimonadetes bacterium]|nr:hypothetical protein [Gemmatimonadota bacterium]
QALDDRPPERDLWAGIASRIGEVAATDVVPLAPRRRRFSFSVPQLAAAVALTAISAGTAVMLTRGAPTQPGPVSGPAGGVQVIPVASPADDAMQSYAPAIQQLEQLLATRRPQLDTATVHVLERSLQLIDSAIAQARSALAQDPDNGYLNGHLQRALDRKLDVLRRAALMPTVS